MKIGVLGAGVVGLSATVELIRRGIDVTCYEAGTPMAERSAGDSRIFRLAHAYPDMVELAAKARRLYTGWAERAGEALIDEVGTVISGDHTSAWAAAMAAAGAGHEVVEPGSPLLRVPARLSGPALLDPAGGMIRVDRVRTFLVTAAASHLRQARADKIESTPGGVRVWSGPTAEEFDAVLICAGAGTPALAADAGIDAPSALEHHVRFSFPLRPDAPQPPQCLITQHTYQHSSAPGTWAVGADMDPAAVSWEGGREAAELASLAAVTAYVTEELPGVEPRVIDRLYCTHNPGLSDGLQFLRQGPVLAVHGENLFKFAPLLGELLAQSCIDGSTPTDAGPNAA
ncbi:FAD-binding oxidoreductase [Actinoplanes sp. NBC_00393]|uniref:NAD(P)/FAD-dependent oxidoreductase n=1 Tax=Actinoplanes sp. NBC_00393 TaxID=2975953 RepID=UPI002E1D4449